MTQAITQRSETSRFDTAMPTYHQLKTQAESLLAQAEELRQKEMADAVADIKGKMLEYGITVDMLRRPQPAKPGKAANGKRAAVPIKYRDKNGNTWTGRGIKPKWLQKAIADGAKLEQFLL